MLDSLVCRRTGAIIRPKFYGVVKELPFLSVLRSFLYARVKFLPRATREKQVVGVSHKSGYIATVLRLVGGVFKSFLRVFWEKSLKTLKLTFLRKIMRNTVFFTFKNSLTEIFP